MSPEIVLVVDQAPDGAETWRYICTGRHSLLVDAVTVIFEGNCLAVDDIAIPAAELQAFEWSAMAIYIGQIAGNEETNLLALA
ncbi:hypothetical protein [Phyllobacterium zundukense]|nr:hypothetical protein [Phyllobacterium zundukense]